MEGGRGCNDKSRREEFKVSSACTVPGWRKGRREGCTVLKGIETVNAHLFVNERVCLSNFPRVKVCCQSARLLNLSCQRQSLVARVLVLCPTPPTMPTTDPKRTTLESHYYSWLMRYFFFFNWSVMSPTCKSLIGRNS